MSSICLNGLQLIQ